jgi:hypothetical protein
MPRTELQPRRFPAFATSLEGISEQAASAARGSARAGADSTAALEGAPVAR